MIVKPNPSLGVPIYLQLMEQVKHAIETGALRAGEQLPGIRPLAEELVINVNTVAKAYRELEREGAVYVQRGAGTFVAARLTGMSARDAAGLGVLMNTRGLMQLIVLNVGLDLGVISPALFTMMVLMALATTIATTPVLRALRLPAHS